MRMTVLRSAAAVAVANIVIATAAIALDQSLPAYHPVGALLGHIESVGSDTLRRINTHRAYSRGSGAFVRSNAQS